MKKRKLLKRNGPTGNIVHNVKGIEFCVLIGGFDLGVLVLVVDLSEIILCETRAKVML